ncbi:MAG: class I SAM-dependent methyltransferase, partial [Deltaproteobacteria bacterium]|nr:class I SAM-dependent methyltransferase [Deltaproteobacteria bacterium]
NAYPTIGTESENSNHANSSGFEILGIHRLPSKAWWDNYYDPLCKNIKALKDTNDEVMQAVIHETEEEIKLFEEYEKHYGYSFYIMKAV